MEYRNENWLYGKYVDEKLTIYQIAEICGCHPRTIHQRLVKFDIKRRRSGYEHCSDGTKSKISQKSRDWHREHIHPLLGTTFSPERRLKHSNAMKERYKTQPHPCKGKSPSPETKLKLSLAHRGDKHPNWQGGLTELAKGIRGSPEFYQWRKAVLERDEYTCRDCGSTEQVNSHHILALIEYPESVFDVENGLTLCANCHKIYTSWQRLKKRKGASHK